MSDVTATAPSFETSEISEISAPKTSIAGALEIVAGLSEALKDKASAAIVIRAMPAETQANFRKFASDVKDQAEIVAELKTAINETRPKRNRAPKASATATPVAEQTKTLASKPGIKK